MRTRLTLHCCCIEIKSFGLHEMWHAIASFVEYGTHKFFVSLIKLLSNNRQCEFGDDVVTVA